MIQACQRHCQSFQEATGPPWIQSSSGAGLSAEAPSGSTSQPRISAPSSAVAVTSVSVPLVSGRGAGEGRSAASPERASILAGPGASAIPLRNAYTDPPSALTL